MSCRNLLVRTVAVLNGLDHCGDVALLKAAKLLRSLALVVSHDNPGIEIRGTHDMGVLGSTDERLRQCTARVGGDQRGLRSAMKDL